LVCALALSLISAEETNSFIVRGENATIQQYPFMAGIFNFGIPTCGGAIINSRSVLTVIKLNLNIN
jgi:secreted trypsin-like serine protease